VHFTVDVVIDRFRLCELLAPTALADWSEHRLLDGWLDRELGEMQLVG